MSGEARSVDVVLVGGGIMSATLGALLTRVTPEWSVVAYERLDLPALESSGPWNNAGTGHAALCELNYSPARADGSIDTTKAFQIAEQFQVSRQLWASLVKEGAISDPSAFILPIPHMSYVRGDDDVAFLRARYEAIVPNPLFGGLRLSEDLAEMAAWTPLMFDGRNDDRPIAMTRTDEGTDVNFGNLTRQLFGLMAAAGGELSTGHEVRSLNREPDGRWLVDVQDHNTGQASQVRARFVFIGAGGRAITLLQKSGIKEIRGYGGFPVGGQFLRCTNPAVVSEHQAKVYGKSTLDAPPMAMPHLDTRVIDGKRGLMFGPFASFTPKFLKRGSLTDLIASVRPNNVLTMLQVARDEFPLTRFLVRQVRQSHHDRIDTLRDFVPLAKPGDWELIQAGQRVQTMKPVPGKRGALVFGTEVVTSADGSIAGLLGASPGASVSPSIMLDVMERCFPKDYPVWKERLRDLIPGIGLRLADEPALYEEIRAFTDRELRLDRQGVAAKA